MVVCLTIHQEPEPFYFWMVGTGAAEYRAAPKLWISADIYPTCVRYLSRDICPPCILLQFSALGKGVHRSFTREFPLKSRLYLHGTDLFQLKNQVIEASCPRFLHSVHDSLKTLKQDLFNGRSSLLLPKIYIHCGQGHRKWPPYS